MVGSQIASYFLDLKIVLNNSSMGLRALRALTGFTGPAYGTLRATGSTGPRALRAVYGTTGPTGPECPYSNLNHDRNLQTFLLINHMFKLIVDWGNDTSYFIKKNS